MNGDPNGAAPKIAVIVPCYNEEAAIGQVIADFRAALPQAEIYIYDNNSRDRTAEVAAAAGAIVRNESRQGKGNVVRRMFADVDADIYVMVDGDATYEAGAAPAMVARLRERKQDMVVGRRISVAEEATYRRGHKFGNALFTAFLRWMFGRAFSDILSGYRVFSRRFVKSFPSLSGGFEIETEISVHALALRLPVSEVDTKYMERPEGSVSKLSTYRDGWRILMLMLALFRRERPAAFCTIVAAFLLALALGLAIPLAQTYMATGLVPRVPTAILCVGLVIVSTLAMASGFILDTVTHGRRETRRLAYLSWPAPE